MRMVERLAGILIMPVHVLRYWYRFRRIAAWVLQRASVPVVAYAFWVIRRFQMEAEMESIAEENGMHLVVRHYYSPIPDAADFRPGHWDDQTSLEGIEINDESCIYRMENVFPRYLSEFRERYPIEKPTADFSGFHLVNGVYMAVDAHVYYAMVREFKPARIIEIGSGMSTQLAVDAMAVNLKDGRAGMITAIEPFPSDFLRPITSIELVESKLQDLDLALFSALQENDILFIDSTHVLREGSDVQLEYLEILPRLNDGVIVHIHDISLPKRYPKIYFDTGMYWNEQYLLQAFLAFNRRFEIIWPGNYMMTKYSTQISSMFPEIDAMRKVFPSSEPSAFWMKTRLET